MTQKDENHFVSKCLAKNFRDENANLWTLNCLTRVITNRHTAPRKLFVGKKLWSLEVENAFMEVENKISPLIDKIKRLPFSEMSAEESLRSFRLSDEYLQIFSYIVQAFMLQKANSPSSKGIDDEMLADIISSPINPPVDEVYLVQYNQRIFSETPLLLVDNSFSVFPTPPLLGEKLEYSIVFLLPTSPYNYLVWGKGKQIEYLKRALPTPDVFNKSKILQEEKKCVVASSSREYLEKLRSALPYLDNRSQRIRVTSERNFYGKSSKKE